MIKAIETRYKGYRFRSRLEARWAVFFDKLGWEWRYEVQGYNIGWGPSELMWLPDFEITTPDSQHLYVEVKGDRDFFANGEWFDLFDFNGGPPGFANSQDRIEGFGQRTVGLLLLGDVPAPGVRMFAPVVSHREGVWADWREVWPGGVRDSDALFSAFWGSDTQAHGGLKDFQAKTVNTPRGWRGISDALTCARAARFEHGEAPA